MAKSGSKKEFAMNSEVISGDVLDILAGLDESQDKKPPRPSALEAQMDEVVQGLSGAKTAAKVYLIEVNKLEPYPNQPFRMYSQERLTELAEDIKRVGILSPILARQHGKKLQILAGHNRWQAARQAGLSEVPVLVMDADDDQAILVVTSTNLRQREKLLPSEKAFAYSMQMEALKRQGRRADNNYSAAAFITEQTGDSRMQIHRYVRLTQLDPGLLELLDKGRISITPAVNLSYLSQENQARVYELMRDHFVRLTLEQSRQLKDLSKDKNRSLSDGEIDEILFRAKRVRRRGDKFNLDYERLRKYMPPNLSAKEAEMWIVRALMAYRWEDGE